MNPDRRVSVKVSQAKKLSDEDIDRIVELLKAVFKDDPFDAMLVGGDLSLQPLQIRSTVEAAAIAGIVHIAYAPSLSQDADNQKDGTTNPGQLVGVALSFGPGQALNATMEQRAAGWDAFLGVIPESLRSWWDDYYGPLVSAGAKEAFGHDYRDRALKLSLFGVLPDHRGMGVGKARFSRY
ncbi:hypothetical protein FA13DRAFT_1793046 [Coprinellus micaceus]|uniref:N-acetyltransferase domain-containing protein n=1 Tax=Coprinellus micaceus TaxID=71717 RepID=A0A4Y7T713_COPMI|nr:hypothetical protein FA13DRAFT_1793046 [Coprinellus micaceus]